MIIIALTSHFIYYKSKLITIAIAIAVFLLIQRIYSQIISKVNRRRYERMYEEYIFDHDCDEPCAPYSVNAEMTQHAKCMLTVLSPSAMIFHNIGI